MHKVKRTTYHLLERLSAAFL